MQCRALVLAIASCLCILPAHAVLINESAFAARGGDVRNFRTTVPKVFDALRTESLQPRFTAVGSISGCTATWLGNEGNQAWLLTSADCVGNTSLSQTSRARWFFDANGAPIAVGAGTSFVHPNRLKMPAGLADASTDVALIRLPIRADAKFPAQQPVLDDVVVDQPVHFVGIGNAGVGTTDVSSYWGVTKRNGGQSIVDGLLENDHALWAGYAPTGVTPRWARLARGDGGSAWWQQVGGEWAIVGVTAGGADNASLATRVSKYADWIKALYPGARVRSDRMRVTEAAPFRSVAAGGGAHHLVASGQAGVVGPTKTVRSGAREHSVVSVPVTDAVTGRTSTLHLRGTRDNGACGPIRMEDAIGCGGGNGGGELRLSYIEADNASLGTGAWRGRVDVESVTVQGKRKRATVQVDVVNGIRGRVTQAQPFVSPDYARWSNSGSVYYVVPAQSGAKGPTGSAWSAETGSNTITVQLRDSATLAMVSVTLRAHRQSGCDTHSMNNAWICGTVDYGQLKVWFDPRDNATLPAGLYRGKAFIEARGWLDPSVREVIQLDVDIRTMK